MISQFREQLTEEKTITTKRLKCLSLVKLGTDNFRTTNQSMQRISHRQQQTITLHSAFHLSSHVIRARKNVELSAISLMVMISACQASGPSSIPGWRIFKSYVKFIPRNEYKPRNHSPHIKQFPLKKLKKTRKTPPKSPTQNTLTLVNICWEQREYAGSRYQKLCCGLLHRSIHRSHRHQSAVTCSADREPPS